MKAAMSCKMSTHMQERKSGSTKKQRDEQLNECTASEIENYIQHQTRQTDRQIKACRNNEIMYVRKK